MLNNACADPEFCQTGSNFDNVFFLVDEGREIPNITISGPSSARQRNAAFLWRVDDRPTLNAGLVLFVLFQVSRTTIAKGTSWRGHPLKILISLRIHESLISLRCPDKQSIGPWLHVERQVKTGQTAWMQIPSCTLCCVPANFFVVKTVTMNIFLWSQ